ncbi:MAG: phosphatidylglycerol lysyltransferase domain-containing protein, partial [Gammaproteobacteria bacterium]
ALMMIGALVAVTFCRKEPIRLGPWRMRLPSGPTTLLQLLVSVIDVVSAGACLYVLVNAHGVPFLAFLVPYAVALMIGVSSHVPGGLGVFEGIMLFALRGSLPPEALTAGLVAYRAIYHLVPLAIAIVILAIREAREGLPQLAGAAHFVGSRGVKLVPTLLACMTFVNGAMLLLSTATAAVPERLQAIAALVPLVVLEVSTLAASAIVREQDQTTGNLALMGDKRFLFSEQGDAFVMFGISGQSWIALGDPVGPMAAREELAWDFRERADREGRRVAFYQTHPDTLPLYLDMGLTPLKLGEEAVVLLDTFTLQGTHHKTLRQLYHRARRDGLSFAVLDRQAVQTHLDVRPILRSRSSDGSEGAPAGTRYPSCRRYGRSRQPCCNASTASTTTR